MEIIRPITSRFKAALFDFDGTISLIRAGWQEVMTPYFTEVLMSTPQHADYDSEYACAKEFIDRLTGKQTIYQCIALEEAVRARGGIPEDPYEYKAEYLRRLGIRIADKLDGLRKGTIDPATLTVPGWHELAAYLHNAGIPLYLASGTDEENVREEATLLGVADEFDGGIYGAKDHSKDCSKEYIIARLIESEGLSGRELIVFGDGPVELELVSAQGGYAVGVATDEENHAENLNEYKRGRLINAGACAILPNLREAAALMETAVPSCNIENALGNTGSVKAAVFGDICLDRYLYIEADRDETSLETGKVAYQVTRTAEYPGGGGNVAKNLSVLGAQTIACGLIGADGEGWMLRNALAKLCIDSSYMVETPDRLTNVYTKPMYVTDMGEEELSRLDLRTFDLLPGEYEEKLIANLERLFDECGLILVADQFVTRNASVMTDRVRARLCELAAARPDVKVLVDSRGFAGEYRNVTVKCNGSEAILAVTGEWVANPAPDAVTEAGKALAKRNCRTTFVTDGSKGVYVFNPDGEYTHVPAFKALGETDICGCGDSFMVGAGTALALGLTPVEAALLGNACAGVTVKVIGATGSCSANEAAAILTGANAD